MNRRIIKRRVVSPVVHAERLHHEDLHLVFIDFNDENRRETRIDFDEFDAYDLHLRLQEYFGRRHQYHLRRVQVMADRLR